LAETHQIAPGDCIYSLADRVGLPWEAIWNDPGNDELRRRREDPGLLVPGDVVAIPDAPRLEKRLGTDERHTVTIERPRIQVRLRVLETPPPEDAEPVPATAAPAGAETDVSVEDPEPPTPPEPAPRADAPFEVRVGARVVVTGRTDGDGILEASLPPSVTRAEVVVAPGEPDELRLPLSLGTLDPVTEVTGVKQRLYHLGLDCGDRGPEETDAYAAAVAAFQEGQGLEPTGVVDDETRDALRDAHGG